MLISDSLRSRNRGDFSSGLRKALSALAFDGISYAEIAGLSGGAGQKEENSAETAVSLGELMDRHIAAQMAAADAIRVFDERGTVGRVASVADAKVLLEVARDEEVGRLAIVNYLPRTNRESRQKLTYMVAYLIATRGTLNAIEMNSILESSRDRPMRNG
ncbi:hypothetical protein ILFOPFJJ_06090 [Ensifer psoraleae]|uniref:hypothetical protein n=1 Tax=Sinorhizobium psoraleae TaxID=520838 RepID=UPI001FE73B27|nr:hypothetical protein [Sinorhizobium psoraleae]NRP75167.1 hypothetical protein [Sinorhizobium psoraleae]